MRRILKRIAIELLVIFVVYVLSIGPMFWYWYDAYHLGGSRWIVRLYGPLMYACRIETFQKFITWYIDFWIL